MTELEVFVRQRWSIIPGEGFELQLEILKASDQQAFFLVAI
jgi:hypothetical protein